jgi:hypothetical protein
MSKAREKREKEVLLNTMIPAEIRRRLDEYCAKEGVKIKAVVARALDDFLKSRGY